ncbi:O-antigen ligase [Sphingopyxis sp.]|uniref:O-antigen ligase family protein n=1 Tax=Sphingopyxis sp. TaxID=1908224 RepID=UPI0010F607EB|nr:O-antigen ligase family protein [Sphingopyxis sp.]MBR2172329.1 O-antigen ligase family protein [Sphingopyxis sp.]
MARAFARNDFDPRRRTLSGAASGLILLSFVALTFLLGGGARPDVTSLLLLRPLAFVALVAGLMTLTKEQAKPFKPIWWLGGASALLVLLHLVPLPPALWSSLPGRGLIAEIFQVTGIKESWQPLTVDAFAGWNSLFSMAVPAAVLILMAASGEQIGGRLLKLLCIIVFASAFLGVLQIIGGPSNGFYLYRITNWESATGLFANRNHNAMFLACGFPLLAVWASGLKGTMQQQRAYGLVAIAGAVTLLPTILITESRAGLLVGAMGLVFAALIYRRPDSGVKARGARQMGGLIAAIMAGVATLVIFLLALSRRQTTIDRLLNENVDDDPRFAALPHIWKMGLDAFPFGWGTGSFANAYKVIEPAELLSENYLNHAHNDFLEIFFEYGLFGIALIAVALIMLLVAAKRLWSLRALLSKQQSAAVERLRLGYAGIAILVMLGVGSVFDYPLRTPSLAALAAIATGFIVFALDAFRAPGYGDRAAANSRRRNEVDNSEEGSRA